MRAVFLDYETVSQRRPRRLEPRAARSPGIRFYRLTPEVADSRAHRAMRRSCFSTRSSCTREHLQGARELKLIALAATGTDNIDLAAAQELGIAVCNVRGYCTASVAQHAWALILSLTQHLSGVRAARRPMAPGSRARSTPCSRYPIRELAGPHARYRRLGRAGPRRGQGGRGIRHARDRLQPARRAAANTDASRSMSCSQRPISCPCIVRRRRRRAGSSVRASSR